MTKPLYPNMLIFPTHWPLKGRYQGVRLSCIPLRFIKGYLKNPNLTLTLRKALEAQLQLHDLARTERGGM